MGVKIGDIVNFREELFFNGAVQSDWFYNREKASLVARNYVFHGSEFFGFSEDEISQHKIIDTITFTKNIAEKINSDDTGINPFSLAIAGYGSGKSHLAVMLASLLAKNDDVSFEKILDNIEKIDQKSAKEIRNTMKQQNLVIVINGMNDFNLNYEILKAAKKSLQLYGINDDIFMQISSAFETAKRFTDRYFHMNTHAFEAAASKYSITQTGEELFSYINDNLGFDDSIYNLVNDVYQDITGHEIRWDQGISAGQILEVLCNEYCISQGLFNKVVLLFDEFGRYLEYAGEYKSKAGDAALQQIFEASQNTEGYVQFIGFIQSDLKSYLTRVDQTSSISRYIGRYDRSDKFYLSSNLETIFANIIEKKDRSLFRSYIVEQVQKNENYWKSIHLSMQEWIPSLARRGAWGTYPLFEKVILEGIYPFHPLTTYMLSSMSDWLQNRSSLMILNNKIREISTKELEDNLVLVSATDILDNDLFQEILCAEEEGRQRSRYAISLDTILKKYSDRLKDTEINVLKANLITKICRMKAHSKEDMKKALSVTSGLPLDVVNDALHYLEVEYGVIAYDERNCSYEFVEDSLGASDFRIFIKRKTSEYKLSFDLFRQEEIREIAGVMSNIVPDFAARNFITTSEWQFEQSLYLISDFVDKDIDQIRKEYTNRYSVDKAKGLVVWLYTNKLIDYSEVERVQRLVSSLDDSLPVRVFLLDDSDDSLSKYLVEYATANSVVGEETLKYGKYLEEYKDKAEENLKDAFDVLKRQNKLVTANGVSDGNIPRLAIYLSSVFQTIYPKVVPFTFDGFAGKAATITKTRKLLCSIERFLCFDIPDYQSIRTQPIEVQRRYDAILSGNGPMSWKVITGEGKLVPPKGKAIEEVYNLVLDTLDNNQELDLSNVITMLRKPPYGMNDMAISLFIVVFLAIQRFRIKIILNEKRYSLTNWSELSVEDSKVNTEIFMKSTVKAVDTVDVRKKFKAIFDQINSNSNIFAIDMLNQRLELLLAEEDLPEDLEDSLTLTKIRLNKGRQQKDLFTELLLDYREKVGRYQENQDLYSIIAFLEEKQYPTRSMCDNYELSEENYNQLLHNNDVLRTLIEKDFTNWAERKLIVKTIGEVDKFERKMKKLAVYLDNLGMKQFAAKARGILERELSNMQKIKERQMVGENINTFLAKSRITSNITMETLLQWKAEILKLKSNLEENQSINKYDKKEFQEKIDRRFKEVQEKLDQIKSQLDEVWNNLFEAQSNDDLSDIRLSIKTLLSQSVGEKDVQELNKALQFIDRYIEQDKAYALYPDNRNEIQIIYNGIRELFCNEDAEVDISVVVDNRYDEIMKALDLKEKQWLSQYIEHIDYSDEKSLQKWMSDTRTLPAYLSNDGRRRFEETYKLVKQALEKFKVEYVIDLIRELDHDELEYIKKIINNID